MAAHINAQRRWIHITIPNTRIENLQDGEKVQYYTKYLAEDFVMQKTKIHNTKHCMGEMIARSECLLI